MTVVPHCNFDRTAASRRRKGGRSRDERSGTFQESKRLARGLLYGSVVDVTDSRVTSSAEIHRPAGTIHPLLAYAQVFLAHQSYARTHGLNVAIDEMARKHPIARTNSPSKRGNCEGCRGPDGAVIFR